MWLFKRLWFTGVIVFDILEVSAAYAVMHVVGVWTDYDNWHEQYLEACNSEDEDGED